MSQRRRVVVADDEREMREAVAGHLTAHGFDVVQAGSGLEALLHVKDEQPHALVLDIAMPHLGGLDALKRIRAFAPSARIVVYSAIVEPDVERQAVAAGAAAVLKKPSTLEDLRHAVEGDGPTTGRSEAAEPSVTDGRSKPANTTHQLRILLIDDDLSVNDVLSEILAQHGAKVFPVTNATDAFRLLAYGAPDAIFLDIRMPGLSGLDALPAIRALAPQAKVVMLSGLADEATVKQTFAKGAFDYIAKPVDFKHLARTVETIRTMTSHEL
jgi:two-component system response regulator (stage 0 sporulation protein F)